jgi:maltose O-acetyltransferase
MRTFRAVHIDPSAIVRALSADIGEDVVIEADVQIACDCLVLGAGTVIRRGARIIAPEFRCGRYTRLGEAVHIEVNETCVLGALADIWRGTRIVAHSVHAGDHLWITEGVVIGGGGARGPRALLTVGNRSAIMDGCLVNVCEAVTIGSDTALSNNVTVLTHSTWHPILDGGAPLFAPVRIGDNVIVYVNAVISPGVTIGNDCAVGAATVVTRDVPDGATAFGNPARAVSMGESRGTAADPERRDEMVREVLSEYVEAMPYKGGHVARIDDDAFTVACGGLSETVRYIPLCGEKGQAGAPPTITLSAGDVSAVARGRCHFDLLRRAMVGTASPIAEDLRDFLRRRTIRIYTDRPFRSLPVAAVARLREQLGS